MTSYSHIFVANNSDRVRGIPAANSSNIVVYDSSLNIVDTFDYDNFDGAISSLTFNSTGYLYVGLAPSAVLDSRDRPVLVYPRNYILVFDRAGDIVDEFGVIRPIDIAINSTGHIFVVNRGNDQIQIYDSNHVYQGATPYNFDNPIYSISIDSLDNIYISEWHTNHISIYDSENNLQGTYGSRGSGIGEFGTIPHIHIDKTTDLLYVADFHNNRIQILDTKSGTFNVTNPDDGLLTVTVPANAVTGTDGLNNTAPSTASVTVERSPPVIRSAFTINDTAIQLEFSEPIMDNSTIAADFTFNGIIAGPLAATSIEFPSNDNRAVILGIGNGVNTISDTNTNILLSYTRNSNGANILDLAGNPLADFPSQAVTNNVLAHELSADTTPTISDIGVASGMFSLSASSTPTVSDDTSITGMFTISASSTPAISDSSITTGMFTLLASSTPTISDIGAASGMFSLSASSTPTVSDDTSITGMFTISASSTPAISDSSITTGMFTLLASSTPTISDIGAASGMFSLSASSTPVISDDATIIKETQFTVTLSLGDGITDPTTLDEIPFTVSFDKPISEFELASVVTSSGVSQDYMPKLTPYSRFNANLTSANDDPYSVATNATGHIFTLHSLTNSIKIWDSNYTLLANTTMGLRLPLDMVLNATGHIFVANSDGDILVYDGSLNLVDNFNDDENPGGSRISATSGGLAFNSTGFLYFANFGGNHILVFDSTGNIVDEFGVRGFGDDPYHLSRPSDISFNSTGHIFVADFDNNRVRIYDSNHVHQGDISGGPSLPLDIEIDSLDNIYISKALGNRIFIYNSENNFLGTYGSRGAGSEEFNEIGHMDIDENTGLLYVADNVNGRIQIFDTKSGTFNVTNPVNGLLTVTVPANTVTDIDGSTNTAPSTASVTVVDRSPPVIRSAFTINSTAVQLEFSEPIMDNSTVSADFTFNGITAGPLAATSIEFPSNDNRAVILGIGNGVNTISDTNTNILLNYTRNPDGTNILDLAGNPLDSIINHPVTNSIITPFTVTLSLGDGITDPTSLDEIPFTVSFDKPISEFELASVETSSGTPQDYMPKLTPHARFNAEFIPGSILPNDSPVSVATNATGHIFTVHPHSNNLKIWDGNYTLLANTTVGLEVPFDMELNATGHIFVANARNISIYDGSLNLVDNFNDDDNPSGSRISSIFGGLAFNSTGFLYLADRNGNQILVFDHAGNIVDEFGVQGNGTDPYHLSRPSDVSFNSTGHIYIVDANNDRVRIYDSNHIHQGDITGNFAELRGVTIDSLDNIYITEITNDRIFIYDRNNNLLGTYGSGGSGNENLNNPDHTSIDETTGLLYVADFSNGRIQIFDTKSGTFNVTNPDNGILTVTVPANAMTGIDGSTNTAPSNTASVTVTESLLAVSLSLGDGVTDPTSLDEIPFTVSFSKPILEFELDSVVTSSGVSQDYMPKLTPYSRFNAQFTSANDSPFGVTTNATGHIFTVHPYNSYVKIWDNDYNLLVNKTMGLDHPTDIELNATGHIFVANAHSIAVYDGSLNLVDTFDDNENPDTPSRISEETGGLAFNSTGFLYLVDRNGHHILVFDHIGNIVDEFGVYGRGNDTSHLYFPSDVTFNSTGHIFIADDGNNRVRIYDNSHVYQGDIHGDLSEPRGVAIDSLDNVYISENQAHNISIYDSQNSLQGTYGTRGEDSENLINPGHMSIDDTTGLLYVADSGNGRIQILDTKNGAFTVVNATSDDILTVTIPANTVTSIDGSTNPVPSNTISVRIDTTAPVLDVLVPELNLISGTLTFDFGDTIDVSEMNLGGIAITDRNGENPITLAGATTPDTDSDVITITLTNTQYANIFKTYLNNGPVQLDVASDAIPNMFGIHFAGFNDVSLVLSFAVSRAPVPVAVSAIDDDADLALDRVISADTIVIDGDTYAVAASNRENGIQIINITNPTTPIPVSAFVNGTDSSYLVGPWSVTTSIINDTPYALVAANGDNGGFVIIDMSNPANPTLASERTDGQDGFEKLRQARAISTVDIGGVPYALVGSNGEDSIHVVDVSDPTDPDVVSTITHGVDNFLLDGPRSISHVTISGTPYAVVASFGNHTQIIDMSSPDNPLAVSHLVDDDTTTLSKPRSVDTVVIDDNTYAIVASQGDNGIQIINITTPASPDAISSVVDDASLALESARYITTTSIDGNTYAVVAGRTDNGVQIIDISDPANPIPVSSVFDGMNGFTELQGVSSISVISIDDVTYAVVASIDDNGIQIVDITSTDTTLSVGDEALQCIVP